MNLPFSSKTVLSRLGRLKIKLDKVLFHQYYTTINYFEKLTKFSMNLQFTTFESLELYLLRITQVLYKKPQTFSKQLKVVHKNIYVYQNLLYFLKISLIFHKS